VCTGKSLKGGQSLSPEAKSGQILTKKKLSMGGGPTQIKVAHNEVAAQHNIRHPRPKKTEKESRPPHQTSRVGNRGESRFSRLWGERGYEGEWGKGDRGKVSSYLEGVKSRRKKKKNLRSKGGDGDPMSSKPPLGKRKKKSCLRSPKRHEKGRLSEKAPGNSRVDGRGMGKNR